MGSYYSCRFIKCILIISFVLLTQQVYAQNKEIDSLKKVLQNNKANDTGRVNVLNNLAFAYYKKDVDQALTLVQEAEVLSKKLNYENGKARCFYIKGVIDVVQSNYSVALPNFNKSIDIYEKLGNKEGLSNCYTGVGILFYYQGENEKAITNYEKSLEIDKQTGKDISSVLMNIGSVYADMGEYNKAITYYTEVLKLKKEKKDEQGIATCYNNLGTIYNDLSNYPLALEYYTKSLEIREKSNDTIQTFKVLNNIGIIYKKKGNYEKALEYYHSALKIVSKKGDKQSTALLQMNIGIIYKNKKQYAEAKKMHLQALQIFEAINSKKNLPTSLNNLGDLYLETNDLKEALQNYERAKTITIENDNQLSLCNSYLGIANVYLAWGRHEKALENTLKSIKISKNLGLVDFEKDGHGLLFKIYKKTGDYSNALKHHEQFKLLSDSILNKENIEKLTQLEYEYKYEKELDAAEEREIKLTKTVNTTTQDLEKSQRNLLLGIITFLLVAIVLGGAIFFLKLRNSKARTENIITEQKLLRSQMTPHFIFNSLSVMQGMILNKEDKKSILYLSKFSKLLRIILENSRFKTVSLTMELEAIENYLALQNLENDTYNYSITVDDNIDQDAIHIPPMLIQPFVENAIEHAFDDNIVDKKINIHLSCIANNLLQCIILDNGIGILAQKVNKNKDKKSLSTTITAERLKILSRDFKAKGAVSVADRQINNEKGTIVTLEIPFKIY